MFPHGNKVDKANVVDKTCSCRKRVELYLVSVQVSRPQSQEEIQGACWREKKKQATVSSHAQPDFIVFIFSCLDFFMILHPVLHLFIVFHSECFCLYRLKHLFTCNTYVAQLEFDCSSF